MHISINHNHHNVTHEILNVAKENNYSWVGEIASSNSLAIGFLGGILKHLPVLLALTCPTTNSFRRLVCSIPIARVRDMNLH